MGKSVLSALWSGVKGFAAVGRCGRMWTYLTARDRNRTELQLAKQHDEGTVAIIKALEHGGAVYDAQADRERYIHRPAPLPVERNSVYQPESARGGHPRAVTEAPRRHGLEGVAGEIEQ